MPVAKDSRASAQDTSKTGGKDYTNKQIAVIGDEDTVIAFGLTGIKYLVTIDDDSDNKEILKSIKDFIKNPVIGFILITQNIAERVRTEFEHLKAEKQLYPIFIELPDKHGEAPERIDPIRILIKRAIGMDVVKSKS